jgi:hypothetical protein
MGVVWQWIGQTLQFANQLVLFWEWFSNPSGSDPSLLTVDFASKRKMMMTLQLGTVELAY